MSDTKSANADQIAYWNGQTGRKWAEDADKLDRMMKSATAAILAAAAPKPGESVLDIGCGTGATALALADAVGPTGRVLGVDVSGPMLAVAKDRAEGRANLSFRQADAATDSFEPGDADLIFSKFGVMFFVDPEAAFANIRRAAKPGGRLAFVCWRAMAENPFATVPIGAALRHLPPQTPPDPYAPGPFALFDPVRTHAMLERAGFAAPKMAEFDSEMVVGRTAASAAKEAVLVGMASRLLMEAAPELREKVITDLTGLYEERMTPEGVTFPIHCWVVTASV